MGDEPFRNGKSAVSQKGTTRIAIGFEPLLMEQQVVARCAYLRPIKGDRVWSEKGLTTIQNNRNNHTNHETTTIPDDPGRHADDVIGRTSPATPVHGEHQAGRPRTVNHVRNLLRGH